MTSTTVTTRSGGVRWQTVALPTEHGSWSFVFEPVLLGLLLAPSWNGLLLSIAAVAAFLMRQPLRLLLKDVRAGRAVPRTVTARRFSLIFAGICIAASGLLLLRQPPWITFVPLTLAVPLLGVQLWHDVRQRGRELTAELAGTLASGALASGIVLAEGWDLLMALGLWLALALRGATAVLYVRARLRLERNKPANRAAPLLAHGVGLLALWLAASGRLLPWTALLAMGVLTIRAGIGLSTLRKPCPAKIIGVREVVCGLTFVLLTALGYAFGLAG